MVKFQRNSVFILLIVCLISISISGCAGRSGEPTILTLWHNYGGQLKETMDELIDEFNETVGVQEGIIISVTSISGSASIHEKLTMSANEEPGAPPLPDITIAYPKTALLLAEKGLLADLDQLFTDEELSAYVPKFLQEGRIKDGVLYVFPTAKSTEVLFLNRTIFNRFASETGVSIDDLKTFEGIGRVAALYYDWTDAQTPAVKNDGKAFFMSDSLFNYALVGCHQLGANFIEGNAINFSSPHYARVWESYFKPAVMGHASIYNGYATDLFKTGEIICSTGSTAGIMFFSPTVTYPDNTTEPAELAILPYPVFEGGNKSSIQRGAGMCIIRSTEEKEKQAAVFLKWFTRPENNLRFVSSTGYLPVTEEAFGEIMSRELETIADENIKKLLTACRIMQREYEFFISPLFEGIDQLEERYETGFKSIASSCGDSYRDLLKNSNPEKAYEAVSGNALSELSNLF
ncbi:MAG: extracellular solute-binding protein [Dethiobacteria bacterium]|jgi:multiple sugar transport system substrate-binding protein|nr:extracellular solute-binding protein [Bacillota bacterium]HOA36264.1 extracellular solute-binding protein [Bacillota bacterium]